MWTAVLKEAIDIRVADAEPDKRPSSLIGVTDVDPMTERSIRDALQRVGEATSWR